MNAPTPPDQPEDAWLSDLLFNFSWDTHLVKVQNHSLKLSDEKATAKYTELYRGVETAIHEHERQAVQRLLNRLIKDRKSVKIFNAKEGLMVDIEAVPMRVIRKLEMELRAAQPPAPDAGDSGETEQVGLLTRNNIYYWLTHRWSLPHGQAMGIAKLLERWADNERETAIAAAVQAEKRLLLERLLQYNGAYIGIGGKRVDNMVHHDVIKQELALLDSEHQKLGGKDSE